MFQGRSSKTSNHCQAISTLQSIRRSSFEKPGTERNQSTELTKARAMATTATIATLSETRSAKGLRFSTKCDRADSAPQRPTGREDATTSQSYITHQRRPAIIPPGVELSPEDERAVRMRTGHVDPKACSDGLSYVGLGLQMQGEDFDHIQNRSGSMKRKATELEEDGRF